MIMEIGKSLELGDLSDALLFYYKAMWVLFEKLVARQWQIGLCMHNIYTLERITRFLYYVFVILNQIDVGGIFGLIFHSHATK